jgi:hypothetical protein
MGWEGHVACMGEMRSVYKILVRKPEGRRPLERPRCRWEGNIRIDLREMEDGADWMHLAQGGVHRWAVLKTVIKLWIS